MSKGSHARVVEKQRRERREDRRDLLAVVTAMVCALAALAMVVTIWVLSDHDAAVTILAGLCAILGGMVAAAITARNPGSLLFDTTEKPVLVDLPDEEW